MNWVTVIHENWVSVNMHIRLSNHMDVQIKISKSVHNDFRFHEMQSNSTKNWHYTHYHLASRMLHSWNNIPVIISLPLGQRTSVQRAQNYCKLDTFQYKTELYCYSVQFWYSMAKINHFCLILRGCLPGL